MIKFFMIQDYLQNIFKLVDRPALTWFLKITPVRIVSMCVCVCVCVHVSAPEAINN